MEEIQKIQKELREAMGAREAGAQAFIRGLTAEVATQQCAADQLPASQVRPVGRGHPGRCVACTNDGALAAHRSFG